MEKMAKVGKVIQPNPELQRWAKDRFKQIKLKSLLPLKKFFFYSYSYSNKPVRLIYPKENHKNYHLATSEHEPCYKWRHIQNHLQSCTCWFCIVLCVCSSFYKRKYAVFLRLFAHQREYQALMSQRWRQRAVPAAACDRVTNLNTHWKTRTVQMSRLCCDTERTSFFFFFSIFLVTCFLLEPYRVFIRGTHLLHFRSSGEVEWLFWRECKISRF